ncbi:peptidase serine carboxypeptidase protein [Pleurostoma richardsiae]|uniref:Peptidase serine carboxypeptidase protein n=1 Tax=Pleurostoma richardsiae TaxID=41990 RepID=A0AA38VS49_9PEZI|nr:peptidase serine carboxypeptidase protein [Pleurostoma richardsiae]
MLSHLRFHRRGPSNPSSPVPDQLSPWEHPDHGQGGQTPQDGSPHPDSRSRSPTNSHMPPSLPPIARVTSEPEPALSREDIDSHQLREPLSPPIQPPHNMSGSGFIGGVALRRAQQAGRPESTTAGATAGSRPESQISRAKPPPPPINTDINIFTRSTPVPVPPPKPAPSSFVAPMDMQPTTVSNVARRPVGTRLMSEPAAPTAPTASSQAQSEAHRAKKGLPFLKNPMSTLLLRRRTGQNPDLQAPLPHETPEPAYDPRIRGTRVHDFSAPRQPRRVISNDPAFGPGMRADTGLELQKARTMSPEQGGSGLSPYLSQGGQGAGSPISPYSPADAVFQTAVDSEGSSFEQPPQQGKQIPLDEKPLPEQPLPPVPPKDRPASTGSLAKKSRIVSVDANSVAAKSAASVRTTKSRKISLSEISTRDSVISALPKHMKSTSSRFSFDMVGAAKQEKILEERHRQREMERKVSDPVPSAQRDSRFDDFDEDGFDYDAMMDDDGLEERIPGVNADFDEEDEFEAELDDPDNDQENFAGFVFQRSDPQSTLASPNTPGMLVTPRDATGKPIGFAMTKDTTPELHASASPTYLINDALQPKEDEDDTITGLGIQGLGITQETLDGTNSNEQEQPLPRAEAQRPQRTRDDDLYFDEGLLEELNSHNDEMQSSTFDESIFDANDTDQFGRPIPGAFAQAQAMAAARAQDQARRESDMTSRFSAVSGVSESTAHTSLSVGLQHFPSVKEKATDTPVSPQHGAPSVVPPTHLTSQDKVAAYQAALAEAAHKAAASGKFRRDSSPSPPPPADLTITSPTTGSEPNSGGQATHDPVYDDYEEDDGFGHNGFDDYGFDDDEFDDEAIIAEANASALANDSDGFYGQEFGFYSAPASQPHHAHHASSSSVSSSKGNGAALSAQNLFEYANGGYFGPSGVMRSKSGRVVSREPNLTPITERSEYSNRNSIMSLALPPALGSDARSPSSLQSPGLAQLAMMADDSEMSLSALMKLRSRAWGGSQASLVSSPRDSSPKSERAGPTERGDGAISPWGNGSASGYLGVGAGHARKNSAFSLWSRDSDVGSGSGSPTLTMSMPFATVPAVDTGSGAPQPVFSPPAPPIPQASPGPQCPPVFEDEEAAEDIGSAGAGSSMSGSGVWMKSPASTEANHVGLLMMSPASPAPPSASSSTAPAPSRRPGMGHRHKGSADSISYIKEEESGETRWVVERRRTGEGGEVEILGREVVEGGRI